jgi:uncharacterized membrane protein YkoI
MTMVQKGVAVGGLMVWLPLFGLAAEKPVSMADLPPAVLQTVKDESRGATLKQLTKETKKGRTIYEAEFDVQGHERDVSMDETGTVVEAEEEVPLSGVPTVAQTALQKAAGGGQIVRVETVSHGGVIQYYDADVKQNGTTFEIRVRPTGEGVEKKKD